LQSVAFIAAHSRQHAAFGPAARGPHLKDLPMRTDTSNAPWFAALAGGAYLLARQLSGRPDRGELDVDADTIDFAGDREPAGGWSTGTLLAGLAVLAAGGWYLSRYLRQAQGAEYRSSVLESIDLQVPVRTAYNQWTQFEQFPKFMATVEEVRQVDDTHLHWRAVVAGKTKEWDSEITEQIPDQRIAWRSTGGVQNAGVVTFHKIGDNRSRVMLQIDYQPESVGEKMADVAGGVKLTARENLRRFKRLVEQRGVETGAWRGTVEQH
jgi:uncharacterized membrane protein